MMYSNLSHGLKSKQKKQNDKMEREIIKITDIEEFGDVTGYGPWKWGGETYKKIEKIHQHNCDGECWDTIIQRESDGKFFKMEVWDNNERYVLDGGDGTDDYIEEVFQKHIIKIVYE